MERFKQKESIDELKVSIKRLTAEKKKIEEEIEAVLIL